MSFQQKLDLAENPVVVITVSVVAMIYLVVLCLARYWDSKDKKQLRTIPLCGKDGPFKYEVSIITGRHITAGKSSIVILLILHIVGCVRLYTCFF